MNIVRNGIKTEKWQLEPNADPLKWDGENWLLVRDWHISIKARKYAFDLIMKAGFQTDGGSIPEIFQNIFSPFDKFLLGYLPHDGFYASEIIPRAAADNILFDILEFMGMSWAGRQSVYASVRIGGGQVWDEHTIEGVAAAKEKIIFQPTARSVFDLDFKAGEKACLRYAKAAGIRQLPRAL